MVKLLHSQLPSSPKLHRCQYLWAAGAKAAPQKGMLAFFPKLGGQKARRDGLQHPKSAPAVQTGALWQHAHMNGQGSPPFSLSQPTHPPLMLC